MGSFLFAAAAAGYDYRTTRDVHNNQLLIFYSTFFLIFVFSSF